MTNLPELEMTEFEGKLVFLAGLWLASTIVRWVFAIEKLGKHPTVDAKHLHKKQAKRFKWAIAFAVILMLLATLRVSLPGLIGGWQ
jgi:hypothetical protein